MARLGRPKKSNSNNTTTANTGKISKYEDCTEVNELLSSKLGFLPDAARDEISRKVPGLVFSGVKYASWKDVEKTMSKHFWKGEDDAEIEDEGEDTEALKANCSACEELLKAKERASNAEQKQKHDENSYKKQFNALSDQLTDYKNENNKLKEEKSKLEEEKGQWEDEKDTYEKLLAECEKNCREKGDELDKEKSSKALSSEAEKALRKSKEDAEADAAAARKAEKDAKSQEQKVKGELINAQNRIKELEGKLSKLETTGDSSNDSSSKRQLKDQISDLKKEVKKLAEQLETEKTAKEAAEAENETYKNSNSAQTIADLIKARNEYEKLFEAASKELDQKTEDNKSLSEQLSTLKTDYAEEQKKNKSLQESLNAKQSCTSQGIFANDGTLFYDAELLDFIRILAERDRNKLEAVKDTYKREYDLAEKLVGLIQLSDWQARTRERICEASKTGDARQFMRMGFSDADGGKHEKLYYRGNPRYTLVLAVTPSDTKRGFLNCEANVRNMLLIAPAKETEEGKGKNS